MKTESTNTDGVKIGLECHAQLLTKSKLFCSCSTDYQDSEPNTHVCATCMGLPGALPVVNEQAIRYAIKMALALGCEVQPEIIFDRKNYYYPDLPKGFQITQYDFPVALNGLVRIESASDGDGVGDRGKEREIRRRRVHMEEAPGELVNQGTVTTATYDPPEVNRAGVTVADP